jgi:hypothetical protein
MKRLLVFALVCSLGRVSVASAEGPLLESGKHAAQQLVQTQKQPSRGNTLLWTGAALLGGGVALMILSKTALHKEECTDILSRGVVIGEECVTEDNVVAGLAGLGVAIVGTTVMVVGVRSSIQMGPNWVAYRIRF